MHKAKAKEMVCPIFSSKWVYLLVEVWVLILEMVVNVMVVLSPIINPIPDKRRVRVEHRMIL